MPTQRLPFSPKIVRSRSRRSKVIWWPWRKRPTVYLSKIRGAEGSDDYERTLAHEMVHYEQWFLLGRFRFILKYLTRRGRLALEGEAFAENISWYYRRGHTTFMVQPIPHLPAKEVGILDYYVDILKRKYWLWGIKKTRIESSLLFYLDRIGAKSEDGVDQE